MSTLVVCIDRDGAVGKAAGSSGPITGAETVRRLVTEVGLCDPEDSRVNCLLEALRVARDIDEESLVAVVTGTNTENAAAAANATARADGAVGSRRSGADRRVDSESRSGSDDRAAEIPGESREWGSGRNGVDPNREIARQVDVLIARHEFDAAIVVIDSAEDERLVPILESRVRVDAVDRVVVRQARDIESTYYLMKQFLADEELRQTVLVPIGLALLVIPLLLALTVSSESALAAIAGVTGCFLLYKGLSVDDRLSTLASGGREALYSGQVSIVTYVVAVGLALVGVFAGVIAASAMGASSGPRSDFLLPAMRFAFEGVPWFTTAALVASAGRLLDEVIQVDRVRSSSLNLPFGVVAVGSVVRGFAAYFLERAGVIGALSIPPLRAGPVSVQGISLTPGARLAAFVIGGVLVSLVGVRLAARANDDGSNRLLE